MSSDPVPPKVKRKLRARISASWDEMPDDKRALLLRLMDDLDEDSLWPQVKEMLTLMNDTGEGHRP